MIDPANKLRRFPYVAAAFCALSGGVALVGWALDEPALRSPLGHPFAMNAATAIGFLFAGASLWLRGRGSPRWLGILCGSATMLIGAVRLGAATGLTNFRIDELLFPARHAALEGAAMAPNTAMNFLLAGFALIAVHVGTRSSRRLADVVVMTSGVLVLIPIAGYAYQLETVTNVAWFFPTALTTALTFLWLDAGLMTVRPWGGLVNLLMDAKAGGTVARRLLPAAAIVPIVLGWLRMQGERAGFYDVSFGVIVMAVSNVVLLTGIVWYTADHLTRLDQRRRAATEARALLASLVESSDDAIIGVNLDGTASSWNAGAERIYGYRADEVLNKDLAALLLPPGTPSTAPQVFEMIRRGDSVTQYERPHRRRDGTGLFVALTLSPVRNEAGEVAGLVMTARDITDRKRAEERIVTLNDQLKERTTKLEAANEELESFSYSVSHDLRAPLRHIDGFADLLTRHAGDALDEKSRRYLSTISGSARGMGQLIDDLLEFSRVGRTELRMTTVDLNLLIREVQPGVMAGAGDRSIEWRLSPMPVVTGDLAMLRCVFTNLFSNAVKYTGPRKVATIEVGATHGREDEIVFVRDNGVGFDAAYAHKLFGVFQRLHGDGEFEGTGIGLANVRRIIHRHGGRTWAEGKPDAGATFFVSFPRSAAIAESREAADERAQASVAG